MVICDFIHTHACKWIVLYSVTVLMPVWQAFLSSIFRGTLKNRHIPMFSSGTVFEGWVSYLFTPNTCHFLHHFTFKLYNFFLTHSMGKNITAAEEMLIFRMSKAEKSYAEIRHQLELSLSTVIVYVKWSEDCKEGCIPLDLYPLRIYKTMRTTDHFLRMRRESVPRDVSVLTIQHSLQQDFGLPA